MYEPLASFARAQNRYNSLKDYLHKNYMGQIVAVCDNSDIIAAGSSTTQVALLQLPLTNHLQITEQIKNAQPPITGSCFMQLVGRKERTSFFERQPVKA